MTVVGLHHLGLCVSDLPAAARALRTAGFDGGDPFDLASEDSARGNGLESVHMRLAFVSDGARAIELIQHLGVPGVRRAPGLGRPGHQHWRLLGPGASPDAGPVLPGVTILPGEPDEPLVRLTAPRPASTRRLLELLGFEPHARGLAAPGLVVAVDQAASPAAPPPPTAPGRSHLAVQHDDIEAAHRLLVAQGYECVSDPIRHDAAVRWFFVRDPGGSGEIEIVEDAGG